jgi:hypothetical protein
LRDIHTIFNIYVFGAPLFFHPSLTILKKTNSFLISAHCRGHEI